jgi:hypothetical protein
MVDIISKKMDYSGKINCKNKNPGKYLIHRGALWR